MPEDAPSLSAALTPSFNPSATVAGDDTISEPVMSSAHVTSDCESCGAPADAGQSLCSACARAVSPVFDEPSTPSIACSEGWATPAAPSETPVAFEASPASEPYASASAIVEAASEPPPADDFPIVRQPWERKGDDEPDSIVAAQTPAVAEEDPVPWWERKAESPAPQAAVTSAFAPPPPVAEPTLVNVAPPPLRPVETARIAPQPRLVARPPAPGAITRPAPRPSRRRPIMVLGASLVVLMVAGVPVAKRWLRAVPTVTVSDVDESAGGTGRVATTTPAPVAASAKAPSSRGTAPSVEVARRAPKPEPARAATRTETSRRAARPDRGSHAAVVPEPTTTVAVAPPAPVAPVPEPEPVAPPPPPVEPVAIPTGPVFEPTQVDDKPSVASQVEPRLPDDMRDRPLTDLVVVRVLVSPSGRPANINVLRRSRSGSALDAAVVAAVRQWSFSPARKRGQPVSCWYNVGVPLRLEGRTSP